MNYDELTMNLRRCASHLDSVGDYAGIEHALGEAATAIETLAARVEELEAAQKPIDKTTSDGFHTFEELYDYRRVYNALLFNEWAFRKLYGVHKSLRHSDGELCFGGEYFIVVAHTPNGQVSNHYEIRHWHEFDIPIAERANKYDGHTPEIALERMRQMLPPPKTEAV